MTATADNTEPSDATHKPQRQVDVGAHHEVSPPRYIAPCNSETLVSIEKRFLLAGRKIRTGISGDSDWKGLALSGGGIRSATFALGAIQALAAKNVLTKLDYVSSVSGGGYISASLQWWWSTARSEEERATRRDSLDPQPTKFGLDNEDFPYGTQHLSGGPDADSIQKHNLRYLRNHGYYLTPGKGLSGATLLIVVLRTIFLSLVIWLPLAVILFTISNLLDQTLTRSHYFEHIAFLWTELERLIGKLLPVWQANCTGSECALYYKPIYAIFFVLWLSTLTFFILATLLLGLASRTGERSSIKDYFRLIIAAIGVAASAFYWREYSSRNFNIETIAAYVLAFSVFIISASTLLFGLFPKWSFNWSYGFRRMIEISTGFLFVPGTVFLLISTIPLPAYFLFHHLTEGAHTTAVASTLLPISSLFGAVSALYGYFSVLEKSEPGLAGRILAPTGAGLFIYGVLTTAYFLGIVCYQAIIPEDPNVPFFLNQDTRTTVQIVSACLLVICLSLLFTANVNYVGLHRFYRDRLMETFMPSFNAVASGKVQPSYAADRLRLSDLTSWSSASKDGGATGPTLYPIINTLAILADDADPTVAARGGSNFIFSPLYIGCGVSGWLATKEYEQQFGPQTVASAMAASGAAINSNAGYVGTGITRNPLVSIVMTLLNMRLGIWSGNPLHNRSLIRRAPTFFSPVLLYGLFGNKRRRGRKFLEIADGGNFDNLGIYELIRRKLSLIIVVDAEADGSLGLPAFVSAVQRVQEDFKAKVTFVPAKGPERFIPVSVQGRAEYPLGADFAGSPFLLANVEYSDGSSGVILYVKATLIQELDFLTYGYRAKHPSFPHQTTVDQFFDPAQFEAYRDLGYRSTALMCDALDLQNTLKNVDRLRAQYGK